MITTDCSSWRLHLSMLIVFQLIFNFFCDERWIFYHLPYRMLHIKSDICQQSREDHCFYSVETSIRRLEVHWKSVGPPVILILKWKGNLCSHPIWILRGGFPFDDPIVLYFVMWDIIIPDIEYWRSLEMEHVVMYIRPLIPKHLKL